MVTAVKPLVVVMGVSGSGKSTVGAALADRLGVPFCDGDALHRAGNVTKMRAGRPLEDADERPGLIASMPGYENSGREASRVVRRSGGDTVIACARAWWSLSPSCCSIRLGRS